MLSIQESGRAGERKEMKETKRKVKTTPALGEPFRAPLMLMRLKRTNFGGAVNVCELSVDDDVFVLFGHFGVSSADDEVVSGKLYRSHST